MNNQSIDISFILNSSEVNNYVSKFEFELEIFSMLLIFFLNDKVFRPLISEFEEK